MGSFVRERNVVEGSAWTVAPPENKIPAWPETGETHCLTRCRREFRDPPQHRPVFGQVRRPARKISILPQAQKTEFYDKVSALEDSAPTVEQKSSSKKSTEEGGSQQGKGGSSPSDGAASSKPSNRLPASTFATLTGASFIQDSWEEDLRSGFLNEVLPPPPASAETFQDEELFPLVLPLVNGTAQHGCFSERKEIPERTIIHSLLSPELTSKLLERRRVFAFLDAVLRKREAEVARLTLAEEEEQGTRSPIIQALGPFVQAVFAQDWGAAHKLVLTGSAFQALLGLQHRRTPVSCFKSISEAAGKEAAGKTTVSPEKEEGSTTASSSAVQTMTTAAAQLVIPTWKAYWATLVPTKILLWACTTLPKSKKKTGALGELRGELKTLLTRLHEQLTKVTVEDVSRAAALTDVSSAAVTDGANGQGRVVVLERQTLPTPDLLSDALKEQQPVAKNGAEGGPGPTKVAEELAASQARCRENLVAALRKRGRKLKELGFKA